MSVSRFCVHRPVTTSMIFLGLVLMGALCWVKMPRELFPSVSFPQLTIVTRYGNAAPEEIENLITKVLEESVGTVPSLKRVRSLSKESISLVTLEFDWGTDMGFAHLATREKIDQIKDRLPDEAEEPIINRVNPFAQPMMIYSVSGGLSLPALTDLSKKVIKQRLEKVPGVASAAISGGLEREILVEVDRGRLEASHVSISAVVDALKNTNLNYPAGTAQGKFYEYLVRTVAQYEHIDEIGRTVIHVEKPREEDLFSAPGKGDWGRAKNERFVYLNALADVRDGYKEKNSYSRYNGRENVSISIQKQAEANTLKTAARVRTAVRELSGSLPPALRVELVYDESKFIKKAVNGVFHDALLGGLLAFLVLYFFLRSLGDASIVSVAIPVSAFIIFIGMYFKGISINMLSLAGLGLAIGNLVDNSIVVVENTARFRAAGKDPVAGAVEGAEEVGNSMVTAALTNVAVILPLLFAKGVAQQLFMDLFFASVGASLVSMMVALTLIPRLAAYPLRPAWLSSVFRRGAAGPGAAAPAEASFEEAQMGAAEESKAGFIGRGLETFRKGMSDRAFEALLSRYRALLGWVMDNPRKAFLGLAALMGGSFLILLVQEKVFMPKFDQGQFLVRLDLPVGTRLDVTNRAAQEVERALAGTAGVKDVTANVGSSTTEALEALGTHQAQFIVALDRSGVFSRPTEDVIADLKKSLEGARLEGGEIRYVLQDGVLSSVFETAEPIVVEIRGPDLATLKRLSEAVAAEMRQVPGLIGVKNSFALPSAETRVVVDKVRAHGYQLQVTDIARTALVGIRGFIATTFKEGGQEIDVRVRLRQQDRASPDDIRRLAVRAPSGVMVPLQEIAALTAGHGPSEIKHLDQQRAVLLTANVLKRSVEDVVKDVRRITAGYKNLADYTISLTGESTQIQESFGGLSIAMVFSVLLIYMIMAAEFESFTQPLIIMTTVPFCLVGVALTLFVTGIPLSAPVILGTIILGGLVVNNGIILIDLMNQRRREGETDLRRLVMEAGSARLRPILMTMLVSILGVLPLALGLSEGSELSSPMASVTFGGLMVSACLSLFVIPMLYYRFESWRLARAGAYEPSGAAQGMMNYEG